MIAMQRFTGAALILIASVTNSASAHAMAFEANSCDEVFVLTDLMESGPRQINRAANDGRLSSSLTGWACAPVPDLNNPASGRIFGIRCLQSTQSNRAADLGQQFQKSIKFLLRCFDFEVENTAPKNMYASGRVGEGLSMSVDRYFQSSLVHLYHGYEPDAFNRIYWLIDLFWEAPRRR